MKEYRPVPVAVELVGDRKARVRDSLQTEDCSPQRPPVEQPQSRCVRSGKWVVEENSVLWSREKLGRYSSLSVFTHLSHTTEPSTLSRIKCERYIFIKKCFRSFIEVRHDLCLYLYLHESIQHS